MNFTLYPAIDLKDGQCVRLLRGEMDQATVFSDSPADQAKAFREAGFTHLHVVDLNGAFEGKAVNRDAVEAILKATDAPVQLGGGIRTRATMEQLLEDGGVDLIGLGRPLAVAPDLTGRLLAGEDGHPLPRYTLPTVAGLAGESEWYETQIARMGRGKDPDPGLHAAVAAALARALDVLLRFAEDLCREAAE